MPELTKVCLHRRSCTSSRAVVFKQFIPSIIETAEVFKLRTKEIHNEIALAAFESCKHNSNSCTCETLAKCDLCPETVSQ